MSNRDTRNSLGVSKTEVVAAWQRAHDDELLDAVASAAALVTCADGKADAVERAETVNFLARNGFLATVGRADILDTFDPRLRFFQGPSGIETASTACGESPAARRQASSSYLIERLLRWQHSSITADSTPSNDPASEV